MSRQPGHIVDIMSTFCEVAEANYPKNYNGNQITSMEGRSLVQFFDRDPDENGRDYIFREHDGDKAVRKGNWKLVALREKVVGIV
ncbi:MAG: hypothetical protein MI975_15985 [Cytophagales bacterium]|nr:hypothetical protein [Cytophagales bacterium]